MTDMLIQEVHDDLRAERMMRLWRAIRLPLFAAAGALILITAGTSIYKHMQESRHAQATRALITGAQAYGAKNYAEASKLFAQLAAQEVSDVSPLAALWQARSEMAQGRNEEAAVLLQVLAESDGIKPRIRDLACVHLAAVKQDALPKICQGATASPLDATLQLLHAAQLWQSGQVKQAEATLNAISDNKALAREERALARRYLTTLRASHDAP